MRMKGIVVAAASAPYFGFMVKLFVEMNVIILLSFIIIIIIILTKL